MPEQTGKQNLIFLKETGSPNKNDLAVRYYQNKETNTSSVFVIGASEFANNANKQNGESIMEMTQPNRSSWVYMRRKNDDVENELALRHQNEDDESIVYMRRKNDEEDERIHRRKHEAHAFEPHFPLINAPTDSIVAKTMEVAVEAAAVANAKAAAAALTVNNEKALQDTNFAVLSAADCLKIHNNATSVSDYHSNMDTFSLHGNTASFEPSRVFGNNSRLQLLMCNENVPQSKCSIFRALLLCACLNFTYGNVVRFPRELDRFGTTFLIPYLILMLLVGLPLTILEVGLGQFLGQGAAHNWRVSPIFKGASAISRFASWLATIWAATHAVLSLEYIFAFFTDTLPFNDCVENVNAKYMTGYNVVGLSGQECIQQTFLTPFWQNPLHFTLLLSGLVLIWAVTMLCSRNSQSLRRSMFVLGVFGILLLIAVTVWEVLNSLKRSYFPDFWPIEFADLKSSNVWFNALIQVLFCTNAGFGVLPTITGKFLYKGDAVRNSIVYICFNLLVNAIAVTLFMVQYDMSMNSGPIIEELKALTSVYDRLQYDIPTVEIITKLLPTFLYGLMLLSALVTMSIAMYTSTRLVPRHPNFVLSLLALLITIIAMVAPNLSIGRILDSRIIGTMVIVAIIFELIAVAWIYGAKNMCTDLEFSIGRPINKIWICCWFLCPVLLTGLLVWWCSDDDQFDLLAEYVPRWAPILFVLAVICVFAFIQIFRQVEYNIFGMICEASKPAKEWGPGDPLARHSWKNWRAVCLDTGTRDFTLRRRGTRDYTNSIKKGQYSAAGKKFAGQTNETTWKSNTPGNSSPNYSGSMYGDSAIEEDISVEKFPGVSTQAIPMQQLNENRANKSRTHAAQRRYTATPQHHQAHKQANGMEPLSKQPTQMPKHNLKDAQREVVYIRRLSDDGRHATRIEIKPSNEAVIYGVGIRNPLGRSGSTQNNIAATHLKRSVSSSRIDRVPRNNNINASRISHYAANEMMERVDSDYWFRQQQNTNQYTTEL